MPKVDASYRHRSPYQIKGPTEWMHPVTGETLWFTKESVLKKVELNGNFLPSTKNRADWAECMTREVSWAQERCQVDSSFPLGYWKEGETRKFLYKHYDGPKESGRMEFITTKQIDFTFLGKAHCLEFYWALTDTDEKKTYDHHTYVYCPGKSMVSEIHH